MKEFIKLLNVYVDWENGKIYKKKEKNLIEKLVSFFSDGKEEEEVDITTPENILKVKSYKLKELYVLAKKLGKTELKETINGKEIEIKFLPDKVIVDTPDLRLEFRADKFIYEHKETGEKKEKEPTLKEFYQFLLEMKKLLKAGSIENYLQLKAREPEFRQEFRKFQQEQFNTQTVNPLGVGSGRGFSWGNLLLGLGGGMLLGYLLGSMMGEAFGHMVENAPPLSEEELKEYTQLPEEELIDEKDLMEGEIIEEPSVDEIEEAIESGEIEDIDSFIAEEDVNEAIESSIESDENVNLTEQEEESEDLWSYESNNEDWGDSGADYDDFGSDLDV
jgi:hypothetical protein